MKCLNCNGQGMVELPKGTLPKHCLFGYYSCQKCNGTGKIMVKQYFYENPKCEAGDAEASDCICWYDQGTGPQCQINSIDNTGFTWRDKPKSNTNESKTEQLGLALDQIPFEGLEEIGKIFVEGSIKYGRDNWKSNPTKEYQVERLNHAIRHLMLWANGDRSESHLAKVAWFCITQIWIEKNK
jgi:hypothetical protein